MASFEVNGIDALTADLTALAEIPDDVLDAMLEAEATVIEDAQRRTAFSMGVHRTGMMISSISRTKIKTNKHGRFLLVYPQGKNKQGIRNAEVAFINEYGKTKQPARPFVDTANRQYAAAAGEAAERVYNTFADKFNF